MASLAVDFLGTRLTTPLIAASGTCGYVAEYADVTDFRDLGAVTTKSITAEPREGNAPWRIIDLPAGMLNAIGLANVGVERFMQEKLPDAAVVPCAVIGSIAGHSVDEYLAVAGHFDGSDLLPIVEVNVSCPNTETGLQFGDDPDQLRTLLTELRPVLSRTRMLVKLSPGAPSITKMAETAVDCGADGLTLINTYPAMAIDVDQRRSRISRTSGGLSGPAIHPIALKMVHDVYRAVARDAAVPIVGLGGVLGWREAAAFILAGATCVGMGTTMFVDPRSPRAIRRGLAKWVKRQGAQSTTELIGQVQPC